MKAINEYVKSTGAFASHYLGDFPKYGKVWEIQYGEKHEDGTIDPTGLPVLVYIKNGEIEIIPPDIALDL